MAPPLSIVSDEIAQDLETVRAFVTQHGIEAIELRTVRGRRVPDLTPEDRALLNAWVRDGVVRVLAVSPGTYKCEPQERDEIARQLADVLPRAIELAVELNAPYVVTFGFDNPRGEPTPGSVIAHLRRAAALCDAAGRTLLLENEPGFCAQTADDLVELVEAVDHPALGVNWDPANSNELSAPQLERGLRAVSRYVRHVHVKNGRLAEGQRFARYGPLREGDIDWPGHLRLLVSLGYTGHLGIETHYEPLPASSARTIAELREMLDEIR